MKVEQLSRANEIKEIVSEYHQKLNTLRNMIEGNATSLNFDKFEISGYPQGEFRLTGNPNHARHQSIDHQPKTVQAIVYNMALQLKWAYEHEIKILEKEFESL